MEILFRQNETDTAANSCILYRMGIERCMLKRISFVKDRAHITKKRHYHAGVEIHIIESGYQIYEINGKCICVTEGHFLLIPPLTRHVVVEEAPSTAKHAITFNIKENSTFASVMSGLCSFFVGQTPVAVTDGILYITDEYATQKPFYRSAIECRLWECILHLYRLAGIRDTLNGTVNSEEDHRLTIAKQYIEDNICQPISVSELASYCYISEKQLERIFESECGLTVMKYVRKMKCSKIEKMLSDTTLSLRQISDKMNFNNEYHFNSFFKKYAGMSPGTYRKTIIK
jgi:AraC-like DNA-binding protein